MGTRSARPLPPSRQPVARGEVERIQASQSCRRLAKPKARCCQGTNFLTRGTRSPHLKNQEGGSSMSLKRSLVLAVLLFPALPVSHAQAWVRVGVGIGVPYPYYYRPWGPGVVVGVGPV